VEEIVETADVSETVEEIVETEKAIEEEAQQTESESTTSTAAEKSIELTDDDQEKHKKVKADVEKFEKEHEDIDKMADDVSEDDHEESTEEHEEEDVTVYEELDLEQLVELMENLVKAENIASIKNKVLKTNLAYQTKFKEFREQHRKDFIAANPEDAEYKFEDGGLSSRFNQSFKVYKQKRQDYNEAQELLKQENLVQKQAILEDLRLLIDSEESLKKIYDEFKNLQDKWRNIGMVPKSEASNLWMSYNFLVDKFFEKVQIDRELRDIGFKKNLEAKIELAEKAEELLLEKSFTKSFKLLQEYHRQWKEIGPVPHDKSEEIWERFKAASEKVNQRRREYYHNLAEEQNNNLILKRELVEKAELISSTEYNSINEWNQKSREMDMLMEEWRKIGPAPKAQNDEIWKTFKGCFSSFFKLKRQYFNTLNEEQNENYNAKLDLCKTAEALQNSDDWNKTTRELKKLQQDWKKIGPVPYKHSEKIWRRFRSACDAFFNNKEAFFKSLKDSEKENLDAKRALIETIKTKEFSADKDAALNEMKDLQKKWLEIGQVPFNLKDKINRDYRHAVDEKLNEIGLSAVDIELSRIQERSTSDRDSKNESREIIQKEIGSIRFMIDKIRSEIGTWENNIGFFANSKNANVLKAEFQEKIDAGNKKIEQMEARVRLLDKTLKSLAN
ncbi:MAG: DUF349 domain-containing protein, partial [Bacteroidales bacterium]|nr:DUF349 domain-containing protein [Bacteroidales bacterium]